MISLAVALIDDALFLPVLVSLVGVVSLVFGIRYAIFKHRNKQVIALLEDLREEAGGSLVNAVTSQLEHYTVGDEGVPITLHLWSERYDLAKWMLRWKFEVVSPTWAGFEMHLDWDDSSVQSLRKNDDFREMGLMTIKGFHSFIFKTPDLYVALSGNDIMRWLHLHDQDTGLSVYMDVMPFRFGLVNLFALKDERLVLGGHLPYDSGKLDETLELFRKELGGYHDTLTSMLRACVDYDPRSFAKTRFEILDKREFYRPLQEHYRLVLDLDSPENREALTRGLLHSVHPAVGLGVLSLQQWRENLGDLLNRRLLEILCALVRQRHSEYVVRVNKQNFVLTDALEDAFLDEARKRFSPADIPRCVSDFNEVSHGLFPLFTRWRDEEGYTENELSGVLSQITHELDLHQLFRLFFFLPKSSETDNFVHPSHLGLLESVEFSKWQLDAGSAFVSHARRLAKMDAELVQTPRMLETMVKLVLLYPYLDSPGAAFLFLKDFGDERALPYLIPHVEAHVKIPELIRIIASEDAVMSAQGRLSLALPAEQEGALTVANHASSGDLMVSDSQTEPAETEG